MSADLRELVRFHLTGERVDGDPAEVRGVYPALLTHYRDLSALRYDYPLVLVQGGPPPAYVRSLSSVVDDALKQIAPPGIGGERLRKHCLRLETRIRDLTSRGVRGTLAELWHRAERELLDESGEEAAGLLSDDLIRARAAVQVDGKVVDCDDAATGALLKHAWTAVQSERSRKALEKINALVLKLSEILESDFLKSDEARTPETLKGSLGAHFEDSIDFEAMARILKKRSTESSLSESTRQRIRTALSTLQSQRFFFPTGDVHAGDEQEPTDGRAPHRFVFNSCSRALAVFQERVPEKIELIKAMATAELEIENQYHESEHDALFRGFDETSLTQEDLAFFPSYLIWMRAEDCQGREKAKLIDMLSSGLPMKALVEVGDIMAEPALGDGQLSFGAQGQQLATMAVGLNDVFVLQSTSSNLYQVRDRIVRGLSYRGPALFSIFTGSADNATELPQYLVAAAAMQSRAFPAFTYDPASGSDWAARFDVEDNPQADANWPVQHFAYEDEALQNVSEQVAFTFVDFAASDHRYAKYFAPVPKSHWGRGLIPVHEYLEMAPDEARNKVPYVLLVDAEDVLHKRVVDDKLIRAAERCAKRWCSLQELGGIHNSHAIKLLAQEKDLWEQEKAHELEQLKRQAVAQVGPEPGAQPTAVVDVGVVRDVEERIEEVDPPEEEHAAGEPYIETLRCTTCDECTDLNNRMFAYDDNKQAYIADLSAGTYREFVEAAEACQVAIIHPGKPSNPNEPGLAELIERAEEFS